MRTNNLLRVILWLVAIVTLGLFIFDKIDLNAFIIIYLIFIIGIIYLDLVVKKKKERR